LRAIEGQARSQGPQAVLAYLSRSIMRWRSGLI